MGSICSKGKSEHDSDSEAVEPLREEEKSREEKQEPTSAKLKGKEHVFLRLQESDISSCSVGEEGTFVGTPQSSTLTTGGLNGSAKRTDSDEKSKFVEMPTDLSVLSSDLRSILRGNFENEIRRKNNKICVFLIGDFSESDKLTAEKLKVLNTEVAAYMETTAYDVILIPLSADHVIRIYSLEKIIADYVKDICAILFLVYILPISNIEISIPSTLSEKSFENLSVELSETDKNLMEKWYMCDDVATDASFRRKLKSPSVFFNGLLSEKKTTYESACKMWNDEANKLVEIFKNSSSGKELITTAFDKSVEIIKSFEKARLKLIFVNRKESEFCELITAVKKLDSSEVVYHTVGMAEALKPGGQHTILSNCIFKDFLTVFLADLKSMPSSFGGRRTSLNHIHKGIRSKLVCEISSHFFTAVTLTSGDDVSRAKENLLAKIRAYAEGSSTKALMICGPATGTSQLLAKVAVHCQQWIPNSYVVIRFCGLTDLSRTYEGLIYHVLEQLFFTHGKTTSYGSADYHKSFQNQLKKVSNLGSNLTIILDDLDHILSLKNDEKCTQILKLFSDLPKNVKIIFSCRENGDFCRKFSSDFSEEFIVKSDSEEFLEVELLEKRVEVFSVQNQVKAYCQKIRNIFPKALLEKVLSCLLVSEAGLLEYEILSASNDAFPESLQQHAVVDWLCLRHTLRPFTVLKSQAGLDLLAFKSEILRSYFLQEFFGFSKIEDKMKTIFKNCIFKTENSKYSLADTVVSLTTIRDSQENVDEKSSKFFDSDWLFKICDVIGPFKVLEELDQSKEKCADLDELRILREVLALSLYGILCDSAQLFSQVYTRLKWRIDESKHPNLWKLVQNCSKPLVSTLIPLDTVLFQTLEELAESSKETQNTVIDLIVRLPKNTHHVIAISSTKNELTVWDISSFKVVRKLSGINQPRSLEMIDDYKCLLLCGRELRIYDLNQVTFLMKLREVMNQKMPFFGLHNCQHVVALSRNRMYVNMMNLDTGSCVSTFKVGEDRFLNSLIVSENGKFCACGDDSQKPSHLLVWDLQQRKLMYDLRIPHHEFLTKLSAISTEGNYVGCVCKEVDDPAPNFIVVYDLQSGTLFKRWKPDYDTVSIAISTAGTCVVVGLENCAIMVFDLITGNCRWTAFGHTTPPDRFRLGTDGLTLVSYDSIGYDKTVRVWDIHTGKSLASLTLDRKITACEVTCSGKCVVIGQQNSSTVHTFAIADRDTTFDVKSSFQVYGDEQNCGKSVDFSAT